MNNSDQVKVKIRQSIIDYLKANKKAKREELFAPVLKDLGIDKRKLVDRGPDSQYSIYMSLCGIIINEMVKLNVIMYQENNEIILTPSKIEITKKEIYDYFINKYLTQDERKERGPESKTTIIKATVGNIIKENGAELSDLYSNEDVTAFIQKKLDNNDKFSYLMKSDNPRDFPDTPIGMLLKGHFRKYSSFLKNDLKESEYIKSLNETVIEAISLGGGELFESLSLNLLRKIYESKCEVISATLTGGPDDNGIDGIIEVLDPIGLREKIFIQAKTKYQGREKINEKTIRGFAGTMMAFEADKGIVIANTEFCTSAIEFAKRIKNLILIGKAELLSFLKKFEIGITHDNSNNFIIDYQYFLIK